MKAFVICCEVPAPASIDQKQAAKYFGVRGADPASEALLARLAPDILAAAAPRMAWTACDLPDTNGLLAGQDIQAHLAGCQGYVLLGVTLGAQMDRAIRRAGIGNVAAGAAADALASALAEQVCDTAEQMLRGRFSAEGRWLTGRYSPGYGDWPLSAQQPIARLLDLPRRLGVTVTDTCLMLPRKSVTALLGWADHPVTGRRAGCATCALRQRCEYRKRGTTCESE